MAQSTVKKIQGILEVKTDGVWGPKSQKALNRQISKTGATGNPTLSKIQKLLRVKDDGFWGSKSQQALNDELEGAGGGDGVDAKIGDHTLRALDDALVAARVGGPMPNKAAKQAVAARKRAVRAAAPAAAFVKTQVKVLNRVFRL